jgi:NAD(P)-dependent dehydrogenase (short-subunit alcohol dehydrogenase family)
LQAHPKLPLPVQAGYATADIGLNAVETALRLYVLVFYTDAVGLSPALGGLAAALAIVWDAVTDPIMGVVSDRTRHRFGGRRMWLVPGGLSLALGVLAVFFPPALDTQAAKFGWLLGSFCFLNTGMTVLSVPFQAMAGEMTEDPHQRNVLFGWRFAFANVGALVAAALPQVFLAPGETTAATLPQVSLVAALLVVVTALISWAATAKVRFLQPPLQWAEDTGVWLAAPPARLAGDVVHGALALADRGIRVNAVAPGTIATELARAAVLTSDEARERIMSRTPMRRLGEPEEIASVVAFLLSRAASYMTGEIVFVDGGRMALNYTVPPA